MLTLTACFKQSPKKIKGASSHDETYLESLKECKQVNFHRNFLKHRNLTGVFKCLGWDREYPLVNKFIQSQSSGFDNFTLKINRKYFRKKKDQNRYYNLLKKINNSKFIQDSHALVDLLSDLNRSKLFLDMIQVSREPVKTVNKIFLPTLEMFLTLKLGLGDTTNLLDHSEFFNQKEIQTALGKIIEELVRNIAEPKSRNQLMLFIQDGNWPMEYLSGITGKEVSGMNAIFRDDYHKVAKKIQIINNYVVSPRPCFTAGNTVYIDHLTELYESTNKIKSVGPEHVLYDVTEIIEKLGIYSNICDSNESNQQYILATTKVLSKITQMLMQPGAFEFLVKMAQLKMTGKKESAIEFLAFFTGEFFKQYHLISSKLSFAKEDAVYDKLIDLLRQLDKEEFITLKNLLQELGEQLESDPVLKQFVLKNANYLFLDIFKDLMINDFDFGGASGAFREVMNFMPESEADRLFIARFFKDFLDNLRNQGFREEFKNFVSEKSLYQFISFLGHAKMERELVYTGRRNLNPYELSNKFFDPTCVSKLSNLKSMDFDSLVSSGIFKCRPMASNYYLYHVYEWTKQLDDEFNQNFGHKFSLSYGVVSPEMMGLYLNLVLTAKEHLYKPDGLYILDAIKEVRSALNNKGYIATAVKVIEVLEQANKDIPLVQATVDTLDYYQRAKFIDNQKIRNLVEQFTSKTPVQRYFSPLCKELNKNISTLGCLSKIQYMTYLNSMTKILISPNDVGNTILSNLLDGFYDGFHIPVGSKYQRKYKIKFSEVLDFFNHMGDASTSEMTDYHFKNGKSAKFVLKMSERLEIVIRDIAFNSNFYGLYFMNSAAQAQDYIKDMTEMQTKLSLLVASGGVFRTLDVFESESKYLFENVKNTYQSLLDIKGPYKNAYGMNHSYVDLLQALMGATVLSSDPRAAAYHPYRPPDYKIVQGHKGHFITKFADLSLITRIGKLLNRLGSSVNAFRTTNLDTLWENFRQRIPKYKLRYLVEHIIKSPNFLDIAEDLYHLQEKMTPSQVVNAFNLIGMYFEDFINYSENPEQMLEVIQSFVDNYKMIKKNYSNLPSLLSFIDVDRINYLASDNWTRKLTIKFIDKSIKSLWGVERALTDAKLANDIVELVKLIENTKYDLDTKKLKQILLDENIDWMIVLKMMSEVKGSYFGVKYFSNILTQAAKKNAQGINNFEYMLKTIFGEPKALELFLMDALNKVRYQ